MSATKVIRFSLVAVNATIHAEGCSSARKSPKAAIIAWTADEQADLEERGFKVTTCKCVKGV